MQTIAEKNEVVTGAAGTTADLGKLTLAVGENARLQAQLHGLFATRLTEFRGELQSVRESLRALDSRSRQQPPESALVQRTTVPVGNNLLLTKVLGRFLMYLEASDMSLTPHLVADGIWEKPITEAFVARLKPGLTVVDIGANYGYYSLLAGSHVGWDGRSMSRGRVYAFEPHPRTFEILARNIQVNGLSSVIKAFPYGALDERKNVALHTPDQFAGDASIMSLARKADAHHVPVSQNQIEAVPIDELVQERVDLMKIDAEGAEPLVFRGMRKLLDRSSKLTIFMEFFASMIEQTLAPREFLREIRDAGFALQWFTPWGTLEKFEEDKALEYPRFDLLLERNPLAASRPIVRTSFSETKAPSHGSGTRQSLSVSTAAPATQVPAAPQGFVPDRFGVVHGAPVWMTMSERVLLYGLIAGLRPRRCLEIGTFKGGSALIITAALDDLGEGKLACVDPEPKVLPEHWASIAHRATLFAAPSPAILPEAARAVGGKFDFALIDGDHTTQGVLRDIEGTLPLLGDHAYLLFHDAHNAETAEGIDRAVRNPQNGLVDAGILSTEKTPDAVPGVFWGGLRLLRFTRPA
ncbi:MAG TPA: FkbM family methyltransferase [Candidatus Acidoferrales bacterium]|jgi:FkbM family methyltransferase|nr:FkbM family methyltransferase [Candidatus Acidoferrales bacterium]